MTDWVRVGREGSPGRMGVPSPGQEEPAESGEGGTACAGGLGAEGTKKLAQRGADLSSAGSGWKDEQEAVG